MAAQVDASLQRGIDGMDTVSSAAMGTTRSRVRARRPTKTPPVYSTSRPPASLGLRRACGLCRRQTAAARGDRQHVIPVRRSPGSQPDWAAANHRQGNSMVGDDTRRFFQHCFNDNTHGWLCAAVGLDPYRDENGKYRHRQVERVRVLLARPGYKAIEYITEASRLGDVYACPYPMKHPRRTKGEAAQRILIHADVDQALDENKVAELGGFIVWSGTPGHGHVYVPLAWPITPAQHEALCRGLAAVLGGDTKFSDNDLLRPPGTLNYKPTVDGGDPSPATATWCSNGRVDPRDVAGPVGVDFANPTAGLPAARRPVRADRDTGAEVELDRYPGVRAALEHRTEDRSADTYRVIAACRRAGLTLAETTWAVRTRAPTLRSGSLTAVTTTCSRSG